MTASGNTSDSASQPTETFAIPLRVLQKTPTGSQEREAAMNAQLGQVESLSMK